MGKKLAIGLIRLYQKTKPLRPPSCRFIPSCSQYAVEAIEKHGFWKGFWLALKRIARCHPGSPPGHDPVP